MPGNQTQSEINDYLNETVNMYVPVFQWVGRPKVEPIDVKIERWVKLVQQKPQSITLQYNMLLWKAGRRRSCKPTTGIITCQRIDQQWSDNIQKLGWQKGNS